MLIATKDKSEVVKFKTLLGRKFEMKDLGAVKKILGIEIHRDRRVEKPYLSQKSSC